MANPVPGQEAIDNGDGTATTRYDDGSSVVWRIDTGQLVSSQPAPSTGLVGTVGGGGSRPTGWSPMTPWGLTGFTNFGMNALNLLPQYVPYLNNPAVAPGYLPSSGTYNQFPLNQPGLFNQINGVQYNQQYGSGGVGDPGNGANNNLTQWQQGDRLFNWPGANLEDEFSPIGNMFLRSDTSSGLGTTPLQNSWMAPLLLKAITSGRITPTDRGKQFLQQVMGISPQQYGNAGGGTIGGTSSNPAGAGGATGQDGALQDYLASIQANAQAQQAAQLAYQDWYMRTNDDKLAFEHAQQEYENKWAEHMQAYQEQKDQWALQQSAGYFDVNGQRTPTLAGIAQEANLTGMYQGKPTFAREQYETTEMNALLGLQAGLRGPENYAQYLKVLGSTPQGMRDVVNAAAGRFQLPSTAGSYGQTQAADVQSLLRDVQSGGASAQADWSAALSGGLPAPNQISIQNWSKMLPTQQSMLMSAYEGSGWDPKDVLSQIQKASPVGAVGGGTTGTFKF